MNRRSTARAAWPWLAALALALPGAAIAHGGGHGSNGDSSNNPFTGDSYAYFHGGHNLGEDAMIVPGRRAPGPPPRGWQLVPRASSQPAPAPPSDARSREFRAADVPPATTSR